MTTATRRAVEMAMDESDRRADQLRAECSIPTVAVTEDQRRAAEIERLRQRVEMFYAGYLPNPSRSRVEGNY